MPFTAPSGRKVVIAGNPVIEELTAEGVGVKPGRLVKKGTAATQVVVVAAATDKPSGWVGWDGEGAHPSVSPATRATAYTATKKAPIVYGPGTIVYGRLASGQNVLKDTPLIPTAGRHSRRRRISQNLPRTHTNQTTGPLHEFKTHEGSKNVVYQRKRWN